MKITATVVGVILFGAMLATAQSDPPATPAPAVEPPPPGMPPGPGGPPPAPMPSPPPSSGDDIHLKSGAILKDVQILRRSPMGYEIQVTQGVSFFIPRKQVVEVKYDDIEPSKQRRSAEIPEEKQALFLGSKIEPAMLEKLNQPLPEVCLKSEKKDLIDVLALITAETGVKIEASELVSGLPPAERVWDYSLAQGTTLTMLLQAYLPLRFTNLAVVYRYDTLLITTREDAAAQEAKEAEASPAPAPLKNPTP